MNYTNSSNYNQQVSASSYQRYLTALHFNRTKLQNRQWAIEQALKQRYNLILQELDRRKAYYQQLEQIEHIRLICTMLTVLLLMMALIWSYKTNIEAKNDRSRDKKRSKFSPAAGTKTRGFFLLGWAPADLYFQDQQTSNSEFNNCYSDDDEDDLSTLIKYQNHDQFYEPGEFLDDADEVPLSNRIFKRIYNLVTLRFLSQSSHRNDKYSGQIKYTKLKQQPRPEFVRPARDFAQMNVITHHQQVINAKQKAARRDIEEKAGIQLGEKDTNGSAKAKDQVQLLRM